VANICMQHIELSGPDEDIERFMDQAQAYLVLTTEEQRKAWHDKGNMFLLVEKHWFDCTWEETTIESSVNWAPSERDFIELSAQFPTLQIKVEYEECSNDLAGTMTFENGEMTGDLTYSCPENTLQECVADMVLATVLSPMEVLTRVITLPEDMVIEDEDVEREIDVGMLRKAALWVLEGNMILTEDGSLSRDKCIELATYLSLSLLPEGIDNQEQCVGSLQDLLTLWSKIAEASNLKISQESLYRQLFENQE